MRCNCFPNSPILDTDIMIVFDKGRDAVKMNVHTLCAASTFFATIFSVPWVVRTSSALIPIPL